MFYPSRFMVMSCRPDYEQTFGTVDTCDQRLYYVSESFRSILFCQNVAFCLNLEMREQDCLTRGGLLLVNKNHC